MNRRRLPAFESRGYIHLPRLLLIDHPSTPTTMNDWDDAEKRVERAQELFEQRRWSEALEELRAATNINPYNAAWHFNIGLTLDELDRFDEAIEAYQHALEIDPNDLHSMTHLGADFRRIGNLDESIATFARIEAADPSFEPSYCHRILVYAEIGDHQRAEEMFYTARLFKEQCPDCYHHLGLSLLERGQLDKAVWCFRKAAELEEDYPDIDLRIAEAFWEKGDMEAARQHYLMALRKEPGNTDTLLDLGELLIEMGRIDEAGEKFHRAIELAPERPAGYFHYGQWLMRHGAGSGGVSSTLTGDTAGVGSGASADRAVFAQDRAMDAFRRSLALDPTFPGAHLRIAGIHHARGERTLARKHLRAEMLLRPQDAQILLELSNLLIDTGLARASIACLKRLVSLDPEHADGWQNLAVAQFLCDRFDEGIESCRRCLAIDSRHVMAVYNMALAFERLRKYEQATYWVEEGLRLDPRDASLQRLELRIRVLRWKDWLGRTLKNLLFPTPTGTVRGVQHLWRGRKS
jgi:tetratricopeptide (TPR) repeat protein